MTRSLSIDDLADIAVPSQPALSPDGSRLVYVLREHDLERDAAVTALWAVDRGGEPRRLTHGTADDSPAWAPDGSGVAFLREGQLWLLPTAGGEPRQLTSLPLGAGPAVWSPDSSAIAFTAGVDALAQPDEDEDARRRRQEAPIVAEALDYQADGAGYLRTVVSQVHVVDVATGAVRQVTDLPVHAQNPSWSPDGARLVFTARPDGTTELDLRNAVHVVAAHDPKASPRLVALADGFAASASYTPDGERLLVTGWPGDLRGHAHLLSIEIGTGAVTDIAGGLDRNVMPGAPAYPGALPQVTPDGKSVLFCVRDRGCTHLWSVPLEGGEPRAVLGGAGNVVSGLTVAGPTAAVALTTATSFGEIVEVDLGTGEQTVVTAHGAALAEVELFERLPREFTISDGTVVEAWLMRAAGTTGPGPLLVDIHGGPHNAWNAAADEMHLYHHELVRRGWTVLLVNPRGSDGYGEAFYDAVRGAWGEADARDFLEPVDALVAEGIADPDRLAVTGYSYGGYMTCYLTAHDDRFAAAVPGGVVSDLSSIGGSSDDAHLLNALELELYPWRDRDRLARLSPYSGVDRVTTPTLVLHGADDRTCPVGQAQQWHHALRERGVPTRMVLYPGASHVFILAGRPSHRLDYYRRVVEWVEQHAGDATGSRPARIDGGHWSRRLAALARRHQVPGAQLGILRLGSGGGDDEVVRAATGVLNAATGQQATEDSVWQIGSISKVWTATVVMMLVDEGKIALDTPVGEIIPELRLSAPGLTEQVTVWHLLTHTSGIDGDIFTDTGRGDDCLEKYVGELADAAQNHPIGATWSYCNSGFSLLGRVIEKVTGTTWDEAMRERLFTPLGLRRTGTLPEEAMLHAFATGHVTGLPEPQVAPVWGLPRSAGPAGLINADAADVLAFARLHLSGGVAADGTRLLSEESARRMAEWQVDCPEKYLLGDSWGLGWIRFDWHGHLLYGHDGNTIGQAAFLRVLPEAGLAVVLLTNGGNTRDLYEDLYREIFEELADVRIQDPLVLPEEPVDVDVTPYLGTYERASVRMEVLLEDERPVLRTTLMGPLAELEPEPVETYPMSPVSPGVFAVRPPGMETWAPVTFYALPTGEEYVHFGARATPRKPADG